MRDLLLNYKHCIHKITSAVLVFSLILSGLTLALFNSNAKVSAATDYIVNSTFDEDTDGWIGNLTYQSSGGENNSGCVKPDAFWSGFYLSGGVSLKADTEYVYSFYIGGSGGAARFYIQTDNPFTVNNTHIWENTNTEKGFVEGTFTPTADGTYWFFMREWGGANLVTYDSFTLAEKVSGTGGEANINLLVNPEFDESIEGWSGEYSSTGGENNTGCIKAISWGAVYQLIELKANTTYTYGFYVSGQNAKAKLFIQLANPWNGGTAVWENLSINTSSYVTGTVTTTDEGKYWFFMRDWGGTGLANFDSFFLIEGTDVSQLNGEENLLKNSCVNINTDGWFGTGFTANTGSHCGTRGITLSNGGKIYQNGLLLATDTEYIYSFWLKPSATDADLKLTLTNDTDVITVWQGSGSELGEGFVQGTVNITETGYYQFAIEQTAGSDVLLDTFAFVKGTEYTPPENGVVTGNAFPPQVIDYHTKVSFLSDEANNMFTNGGFESTPVSGAGWNINGFSDVESFSVDSAEKYNGSKSLKFTGGLETTQLTLTLSADARTEYTFGAWVKGGYLSTEYPGSVKFGVVDEYGNFAEFSEDALTHTSVDSYFTAFARDMKWHRVGFKFKTGDAPQIKFVIRGENALMWFDDIVISKSENCTENSTSSLTAPKGAVLQIITNPSCNQADNLIEEISLSNAEYWADTNICRSAVRVSKDPRNSANEVLLYEPTEYNTSNSYYSRGITVEKNTDYVFSAFYRSDVSSEAAFGLYYSTDWSSPVLYSVSSSDVGNWKFVKYKFNTNDYDKLTFFIRDSGGNLILDDVRLFKSSNGTYLNTTSKLSEMNSALSSLVSSAPSSGTVISNYASREDYNVSNWAADSAELNALLEADTDYVWSFNVKDSNSAESFKLTLGGETVYYGKATNGHKTGLLKTGKTAPGGNFAEFSALNGGGEYSISDLTVTKLAVGDTDCNTTVADANDLVFLRKILIGAEEIRSDFSTDLNGDSAINIIDLVRMKKNSAE